MDNFKDTNVPEYSYRLSEFKDEMAVFVYSEIGYKDNADISLMEDQSLTSTKGLTSKHEENSNESDDNDEDGIYSPLAHDALLQDFSGTVIDQMVISSPNKTSKDLLPSLSPEKVASTFNSVAPASINYEKVNEKERENNIIQSRNEPNHCPSMDENEKEEFKEVSVQTVENKQSSFCPLCKLENQHLRNKIFALFLEYARNKRKIIEIEKNVLKVCIDGNGDAKKRTISSDAQIGSKSPLKSEYDGDEKRGLTELSSRKIRLGLSRRVKLLPLHQMSNSKKAGLPDYSSK